MPCKGLKHLCSESFQILDNSDVILTSERFTKELEKWSKKIIAFPEKLLTLPQLIKTLNENNKNKFAIVASGDPNFFGITNFLKKHFPLSIEKIVPALSSMQEAFARLKINWDDATFFSIHGRDKDKLLAFLLKNKKGFIFTSNSTDVLYILNLLKEHRLADYTFNIIENIGTKEERLLKIQFPYILKEKVSDLNVIIFERDKGCGDYIGLGLNEDMYEHKKGMITKKEIRLNILAMLELKEGIVLWDIGSGSGSVAIEASFNPLGVLAFAIEKDETSFGNLKKNIDKFGAVNVIPMLSNFKDIYEKLPLPDRIFIGGSGIELSEILAISYKALKSNGIIVIASVTLDSLYDVIDFCMKNKLDYEVTGLNIFRSKTLKKHKMLEGLNPIFILKVRK